MAQTDVMRLFAMWMLAHEEADELMKDAVERGRTPAEGMSGGADAFTDGFMAMVAEEKERLKREISEGGEPDAAAAGDDRLDELAFEVSELRGRLDAMQATLDSIAAALTAQRS